MPRYWLAILPGHEGQAVADQMDMSDGRQRSVQLVREVTIDLPVGGLLPRRADQAMLLSSMIRRLTVSQVLRTSSVNSAHSSKSSWPPRDMTPPYHA